MPASHRLAHPRLKLSKLCAATARYVGERSTRPRLRSPTSGDKAPPKACAVCGPGFGEGEESKVKEPSQGVACTHA
jgi:hypothetical protein